MCYQFFREESTLFTPKNMPLERIHATSLANYKEDSLDDVSFVSQSRFNAYATCNSHEEYSKEHKKVRNK